MNPNSHEEKLICRKCKGKHWTLFCPILNKESQTPQTSSGNLREESGNTCGVPDKSFGSKKPDDSFCKGVFCNCKKCVDERDIFDEEEKPKLVNSKDTWQRTVLGDSYYTKESVDNVLKEIMRLANTDKSPSYKLWDIREYIKERLK